MKRLIKFGLALAALAFVVPAAQAQTTETFTATATVASSLTITENTALSFGSLVVINDAVTPAVATGRVAPTGAFSVPTAPAGTNLIQTGTPTAGNFTINTGVTSFVNVEITFPATTTLTNGAAPPGNGTFVVDRFQIAAPAAGTFTGTTANLAACNTAIAAAGGDCQFVTSAGGLVTFAMGADIESNAGTSTYIDGTYTGTYDITAAFF